jgi:hypothetical protein
MDSSDKKAAAEARRAKILARGNDRLGQIVSGTTQIVSGTATTPIDTPEVSLSKSNAPEALLSAMQPATTGVTREKKDEAAPMQSDPPDVPSSSLTRLSDEAPAVKKVGATSLVMALHFTARLRTLVALASALALSYGWIAPRNLPLHPFALLMWSQWGLILLSWALIANIKSFLRLAASMTPPAAPGGKKPQQLLQGILNMMPGLGPMVAVGKYALAASASAWDNASVFVVLFCVISISRDLGSSKENLKEEL